MWTVDQYQDAFDLIPELSTSDISNVLHAAGKDLKGKKRDELRKCLNEVLRTYVVERIFAASKKSPTRTKLVRHYRAIENVAIALLKQYEQPGEVAAKAKEGLRRAAYIRRRELAEHFSGNPTIERLQDLQHNAAFRSMSESIRLLAVIAEDARLTEQKQIERERSKPRHKGDVALQNLFGDIHGIWLDQFDELPGVTIPTGDHSNPLGAYIDLVKCVMHSFARKVPDELENLVTSKVSDNKEKGLRRSLEMTPNAIYGHYRRTGISKLKS